MRRGVNFSYLLSWVRGFVTIDVQLRKEGYSFLNRLEYSRDVRVDLGVGKTKHETSLRFEKDSTLYVVL
jgi:hypothetical protein